MCASYLHILASDQHTLLPTSVPSPIITLILHTYQGWDAFSRLARDSARNNCILFHDLTCYLVSIKCQTPVLVVRSQLWINQTALCLGVMIA
jgi:hypothetical protein